MIDHLSTYATDFDTTRAFYEAVGFRCLRDDVALELFEHPLEHARYALALTDSSGA